MVHLSCATIWSRAGVCAVRGSVRLVCRSHCAGAERWRGLVGFYGRVGALRGTGGGGGFRGGAAHG